MDTIITYLQVTDTTITGTIENILAGVNRKFELFAYDADTTLLYYGYSIADVIANQTVPVYITLYPVGNTGTVIIIGSIGNTPPPKDLIVFHSNLTGNNDIYLIHPDGTGLVNLTHSAIDEKYAQLSPDGNKVAYQAFLHSTWRIFIMDLTTFHREEFNVLPNTHCGYPSWSSDASKLTFHAGSYGNNDIYVANIDGTGLVQLTQNTSNDIFPNWSPDDSKIVFFSNRDYTDKIYVINSDGSNLHRLTLVPNLREKIADWSPDGSRIVFYAKDESYTVNWDMFLINPDGSNLSQLTNTPWGIDELHETWSPYPDKIVFARNDGSMGTGIYIMKTDGSGLTKVFDSPADDDYPHWVRKH